MSFGGSVAAMITSLKSNNNLRLNRTKYFNKDARKVNLETDNKKHLTYKHLTKKEILEIREEISAKNKIEILKKITAVIVALMIAAVIMLLLVKFFDGVFIT